MASSRRVFRIISGAEYTFLLESKRKESSWVNWDAEELNKILHNYWSRKEMPVLFASFLASKEKKLKHVKFLFQDSQLILIDFH